MPAPNKKTLPELDSYSKKKLHACIVERLVAVYTKLRTNIDHKTDLELYRKVFNQRQKQITLIFNNIMKDVSTAFKEFKNNPPRLTDRIGNDPNSKQDKQYAVKFLGWGAFNLAFQFYPEGEPDTGWVYKITLQHFDLQSKHITDKCGEGLDDPKRAVRLWNQRNNSEKQFKTPRAFRSQKYAGWFSPYVRGERLTPALMARLTINLYIKYNRCLVDAYVIGNARIDPRFGLVIYDLGLLMSRKRGESVVSDKFRKHPATQNRELIDGINRKKANENNPQKNIIYHALICIFVLEKLGIEPETAAKYLLIEKEDQLSGKNKSLNTELMKNRPSDDHYAINTALIDAIGGSQSFVDRVIPKKKKIDKKREKNENQELNKGVLKKTCSGETLCSLLHM